LHFVLFVLHFCFNTLQRYFSLQSNVETQNLAKKSDKQK